MSRHQTKLMPLLTWRGAIGDSDLPSTTRHVALALSIYMSEKGDSAHPGPTRLAKETGLCLRAVKTGLANLVDEGWLVVVERGGLRGEKRRANEYRAAIPSSPLPFDQPPATTRAGGAPVQEVHPCTTVTRASHVTTRAPHAGVPVHQVHPISPTNSPGTLQVTPPTPPAVKAKKRRTFIDTPEFVLFWEQYPRHEAKTEAREAWAKAILRAPVEEIISGAEAYARTCEQRGTENQYIKHPSSWLNKDRWTDEPDRDGKYDLFASLIAESRGQQKALGQ